MFTFSEREKGKKKEKRERGLITVVLPIGNKSKGSKHPPPNFVKAIVKDK